jgi:hypothetical protein
MRRAVSRLKIGIPSKICVLCLVAWCVHHATRHNATIHNILSTDSQLSIFQKRQGTIPEDGNVMPKQAGATIHN